MRFAICNEIFHESSTFADAKGDLVAITRAGCDMAAGLGYTGLEVAPYTLASSVDELSPATRRQFAQAVAETGMEIIGLHWLLAKTEGFHLTTEDGEIRNRTAAHLIKLVQLCAELGGEIMVLGSPQQRNFPPSMDHASAQTNAVDCLKQVVPHLEKHAITLALEPLGPTEGNFWNQAAQAVTAIEACGSKNIKLHLDVKAMSSEALPIPEIIRQSAEHVAHFHANDPNLLGPGMGDVSLPPIFSALNEIDYQGWVSVEVFNFELGAQRIAADSISNMRAALKAV